MSYNITLSNGNKLTTVSDGTTDTTSTSLTLIGKNFAGYGQFLNENFVNLLENFSNPVSPTTPIEGQLWWDSKSLKVWTGIQWKNVSSTTTSAVAPTGVNSGDLWWDTANQQLKAWSALTDSWVVIGPAYSSSQGLTGAVAAVVYDSPNNNKHIVIEFYVAGHILAILSGEPNDPSAALQYTLASPIDGFTVISPGLNLSPTNKLQYNGDASNSVSLGPAGVTPLISYSQYLRKDIDQVFGANLTITPTLNGSNLVVSSSSASSISVSGTTSGSNVIFSANVSGIQTSVLTLDATNGVATVPNVVATSPGLTVVNKNYVDNSSFNGTIISAKSSSLVTTSTSAPIATISSQFSSAEFLVQAKSLLGSTQVTKLLAVSDGTNSWFTEFGSVTNGTPPPATYSTTVVGGVLQLIGTSTGGSVTFKVTITSTTV